MNNTKAIGLFALMIVLVMSCTKNETDQIEELEITESQNLLSVEEINTFIACLLYTSDAADD